MPSEQPSLAALLGTGARMHGGSLLISLSARILAEPPVFVLGTFAYGDGKPLVLIAEDVVGQSGNGCFPQLGGRESPFLFSYTPVRGELEFKFAWLEAGAPPRLNWLSPSVKSAGFRAFDFGTGWGGVFSLTSVGITASPLSPTLSPVYESRGLVRPTAGSNGVAAWAEWVDAGGRIIAWNEQQGAITIATGPWYPTLLGMSPEKLVWIGATGSRVEEGAYETASLYWCERPNPLGACAIKQGPSLPIFSSTGVLSVHGRWAALTGCSEIDCDVLVVDWTDSAVYRIRRIQTDHGTSVIAVSDNELFVADFSPQARGTPNFDRLIRYDLSQLSSYATRL